MRFLLIILLTLSSSSLLDAQSNESQNSSKSRLSVEPFIGINMIETKLNSESYFSGYMSNTTTSGALGANLVLQLNSKLVFETGVNYFSYNTSIDSLNIPPRSSPEIYGVVDMSYSSINIPLLLALDLNIGSALLIRPSAGFVLRFIGEFDYSEVVSAAGSLFSRNIQPAEISSREAFGVATQLGLKILGLPQSNLRPFVSLNYFNSTSNFEYFRGSNNTSINDRDRGNISNQGLFVAAGVSFGI